MILSNKLLKVNQASGLVVINLKFKVPFDLLKLSEYCLDLDKFAEDGGKSTITKYTVNLIIIKNLDLVLKKLKGVASFKIVEKFELNSKVSEIEIKLPKAIIERQKRYADAKSLLTKGVSQVVVYEEVMSKLVSGQKLRIKHGVDPTTSDLHLGYAVNYLKLREFQDRGHTIVFLIGSFTARFGDPTDKAEARKMRSKEDVMLLAKNYIKQVGRILNLKKLEVRYNGDWFDDMSVNDFLKIMSEFTVAQMLERDMFSNRIKEGKSIGLHEIVYPVMQGYDSVEIKSDLTVVGTDQLFNELQARPLQSLYKQSPQSVIAMNLLVGTDGVMKMSQSLNNYVGFDDDPMDKFGKIMSIPDKLIVPYFESCTLKSEKELNVLKKRLKNGDNPRDLKFELAYEIVKMFDGAKNADYASEQFNKVFQQKSLPDEIPTFVLVDNCMTVIDLLLEASLVSSKSEARRLIEQGALKVNNEKVVDLEFQFLLKNNYVIQLGKRKFLRVA